jgi:aryl-alcohol dehydrogenase-like predicted oxidoreductase
MEYRRLGNTGLEVSVLGLGGNNFGVRADEEMSNRVIDQAMELGVNFIDTANIYAGTRSEEIVGKQIKPKRQQVVLVTKFGAQLGEGPNTRGGSRKHVMDSAEASLRRLQTDYIDLYLIHFPDDLTPIEETLRAMEDLVQDGKVRYIGCSNFVAWRACEAAWTAKGLNRPGFVCIQNHYNLLVREPERDVIPFCEEYQWSMMPYFPLASGLLTGKYRLGEEPPAGSRMTSMKTMASVLNEESWAIITALEKFSQERGRTLLELAHAWLLANPVVDSVISGATKPEQVVANAKGVDWKLSAEDMAAIDEIVPSPRPPARP